MRNAISLEEILDFQQFMNDFRDIKRVISYEDSNGEGQYEDDAQHSFHTAMLAWFLVQKFPELDSNKVIKLALVHDLVEVYAGDEMALGRTHAQEKAKKKREALAAEQIRKRFKNFPDMHKLISEYEERKTPEAQFVYDIDKLAPMIHNISVEGHIWKKLDLERDFVITEKSKKITKESKVFALWQQLKAHLLEHDNLFNKTS